MKKTRKIFITIVLLSSFGFSVFDVIAYDTVNTITTSTESRASVNLQRRNKEFQERAKMQDAKRNAIAEKRFSGEKKKKVSGEVCQRLNKIHERLKNRIERRMADISSKFDNKKRELKSKREKYDKNIKSRRDRRDAIRNNFYVKLKERAKDQQQKEAVERFKEEIESAIKTRRESIDSAINAFRLGVDEAIVEKKNFTESLITEFQKNELLRVKKIEAMCTLDTDKRKLRNDLNDLKSNFRSSGEKYQEKFKNSKKIGETIKELSETKRKAIKQAIETFKSQVKSAQAELKKAFENKGESSV